MDGRGTTLRVLAGAAAQRLIGKCYDPIGDLHPDCRIASRVIRASSTAYPDLSRRSVGCTCGVWPSTTNARSVALRLLRAHALREIWCEPVWLETWLWREQEKEGFDADARRSEGCTRIPAQPLLAHLWLGGRGGAPSACLTSYRPAFAFHLLFACLGANPGTAACPRSGGAGQRGAGTCPLAVGRLRGSITLFADLGPFFATQACEERPRQARFPAPNAARPDRDEALLLELVNIYD